MKDEENDEEPHEEEKLFLRLYVKYNKHIHASGNEGKLARADLFWGGKLASIPSPEMKHKHTAPRARPKSFLTARRNTIEVDVF